jgi:putative peptidoglycan lipid II flippase
MLLLRNSLASRVGSTRMPAGYLATLWSAALVGALVGWAIKLAIGELHPVIAGGAILVPYGVCYFAVTLALGVPEAKGTIASVGRRVLPRRR